MNYPIPSHLWARRAAEYAACVGSKPVFWKLHDFLFDHQMEITPQNLRTNLAGFWEGLPASDREGLSVTSCGGSDGAVRRVDEDVAFGNGLNISATPTLFVNGQRIVGLPNVDQIVDIISRSQSPTH
jgi:protein-disulfide isomerase